MYFGQVTTLIRINTPPSSMRRYLHNIRVTKDYSSIDYLPLHTKDTDKLTILMNLSQIFIFNKKSRVENLKIRATKK